MDLSLKLSKINKFKERMNKFVSCVGELIVDEESGVRVKLSRDRGFMKGNAVNYLILSFSLQFHIDE
jgi:hypothetical protein